MILGKRMKRKDDQINGRLRLTENKIYQFLLNFSALNNNNTGVYIFQSSLISFPPPLS